MKEMVLVVVNKELDYVWVEEVIAKSVIVLVPEEDVE